MLRVISLIDEPEAYEGREVECQDLLGMFISVATTKCKNLPPGKGSLPWSRIKSDAMWEGTTRIQRVIFANFKDDLVPGCENNRVFNSNEDAAEASHNAHLSEITLTNVGEENKFYFEDPDLEWISVDGCGGWFCTGIRNILVKDEDGSFVGQPSIIYPNNRLIADQDTCTFSKGKMVTSVEELSGVYLSSKVRILMLILDFSPLLISQDLMGTEMTLTPTWITNGTDFIPVCRDFLGNMQLSRTIMSIIVVSAWETITPFGRASLPKRFLKQ